MSRVLGVRLLLTLFALACVTASALIAFGVTPGSEFPVRLTLLSHDQYRVRPAHQTALPAGLRAGDLVPLRRLSPAGRAALFTRYDVLPGTVLTLPIIRDGKPRDVSLASVPDLLTALQQVEFLGFQAAMLAIAMLTLWRGREWAAWGLSGVFLGALFVAGPLQLPVAPQWVFWRDEFVLVTRVVLIMPALFVFADALAGANLPSRLRWTARASFMVVALATLALAETHYIGLVRSGVAFMASGYRAIMVALTILAIVIPLLLLFAGHRVAAHEDRLRIRWVLWSTALLFAGNLIVLATPQSWRAQLTQVEVVTQGIALLGYLYAVLRTRLIDVAFVVDRALVFGLLTALVFGTFSILELALHQFAVSDKVGWALQAVAALVLAVVLSPLHRRLESWIEQAFFRSQRLALLALERFARECPFVEREPHLLEMAIERLKPQCAAVAVYERAGSTYRRRAASEESWPVVADADDPAFVALRASHEPVPLAAQASRLGSEGLALPMTVAESLLGALVCRPRDGEQFAPEVRAALANAAHNLGMALDGLRHREHARLVADVAAGRIDADAARRRAIRLLEGELPQADPGVAR